MHPGPPSPRALSDLSCEELGSWLEGSGFKASHAEAVIRRLLKASGPGTASGTRMPATLQARLQSSFAPEAAHQAMRQVSEDGTTKLLLRLHDGRTVESVLMPDYHDDRAAGCISSQVGCAMACDFCATTQTGFERNLSSGEIIEQFLHLQKEARAAGRTLRTLVFMGMGEPMLNLKNVIAAVKRIADPRLGAFGWRQITVSTVGIVPGIDELRESGLGVHLAVSLHAPDDRTRTDILPMGRRFPVRDVLAAADRYQADSGRITTIQYCLLEGVNDSLEQARELARLLDGRRMHVNLLRYNPTGLSLRGRTYAPSSMEQTEAFLAELRAFGAVAHLRRARGPDIDAACGQLRKRQTPDIQNPAMDAHQEKWPRLHRRSCRTCWPHPMKPVQGYHLIAPDDLQWRLSSLMQIPNADYLERTGSENLGARLWRLPPASANTLHKHLYAEEFYFLLEGTGRMRVGTQTLTVPKYGGVLVGPDQLRQVFNDTQEDALWLIIGAPEELELLPTATVRPDLTKIYPVDPTQLPGELKDAQWPPAPDSLSS